MRKHLEEAGTSACEPGVLVAGSPLDDEPLEVVEVRVQTEHISSFVDVAGAGPPAGSPAVAGTPEHGVVLKPLSPPAAWRRPEVEQDNSLHPTIVELRDRWHRLTLVNISLNEVVGFGSPASERLEIRLLQKMLQTGNELAHQKLKAYLGGSTV